MVARISMHVGRYRSPLGSWSGAVRLSEQVGSRRLGVKMGEVCELHAMMGGLPIKPCTAMHSYAQLVSWRSLFRTEEELYECGQNAEMVQGPRICTTLWHYCPTTEART